MLAAGSLDSCNAVCSFYTSRDESGQMVGKKTFSFLYFDSGTEIKSRKSVRKNEIEYMVYWERSNSVENMPTTTEIDS